MLAIRVLRVSNTFVSLHSLNINLKLLSKPAITFNHQPPTPNKQKEGKKRKKRKEKTTPRGMK